MTKSIQLCEWLLSKGLISSDSLKESIAFCKNEEHSPLYLKVLLGIGSFIASMLFLSFLGVSNLIDFNSAIKLTVCGTIFIAIAIAIHRFDRNLSYIVRAILVQSSFSLMIAGKLLFALGCLDFFKLHWGSTFGIVLVTVITYGIYNLSVDRFIFPLISLLSIFNDIVFYESSYRIIMFNTFFISEFIVASFLLTYHNLKSDFYPLIYSFVISICINLVVLCLWKNIAPPHKISIMKIDIINFFITFYFIALLVWIFYRTDCFKLAQLVLLILTSLILGVLSVPGLLLSAGLTLLGYLKHEKIITALGIFFIAVFFLTYYYTLDIPLINKSFVLIVNGIVLLMVRLYLVYMGLVNEEKSCERR
ncbi:DUF4401 domain-containing protein [Candidatus Ichthyocystis sparus]|nr:DUF4401 domain-containing protein [Candidatus Ichthyocystis sparus]